MSTITATHLLDELQRVVAAEGDVTLFRFREATGIGRYYVYDRWGNWTNLRRAAGRKDQIADTVARSEHLLDE